MPNTTPPVRVEFVDYSNEKQTEPWKLMLNTYAKDPMGGANPIPAETLDSLPQKLAAIPSAFSLLAFVGDKPAGMANCFFGFSTFAARPLINIHDLGVSPEFRGKGVGYQLLAAIEKHASESDCCKLTLEVLANNHVAKKTYARFGFGSYELDAKAGNAEFWEKKL